MNITYKHFTLTSSDVSTSLIRAFSLLLLSLLAFAGCQSPQVVERTTDLISGNWQFEIQGGPGREDQTKKFNMRLKLQDGKITGVALSIGDDNHFPSTDINGVLIGDKIEFDRFLQPDPKFAHRLHAGKFSGAASKDGTKLAGTALLDPQNNYYRDWVATKISN